MVLLRMKTFWYDSEPYMYFLHGLKDTATGGKNLSIRLQTAIGPSCNLSYVPEQAFKMNEGGSMLYKSRSTGGCSWPEAKPNGCSHPEALRVRF